MSGVETFTRALSGDSAFNKRLTKKGKLRKLQSGSKWGRGELEYFGTDFEGGRPLAELLGPEFCLPPSCRAAQYIKSSLDKEWKDILELPYEQRAFGVYGSLVNIRTVMQEPEDYEKSTLPHTDDEAENHESMSGSRAAGAADLRNDPGSSPPSRYSSSPSALLSGLSISTRPTQTTRTHRGPTLQADLEADIESEDEDLEPGVADDLEEGSSYQDRMSEVSQRSKTNSFHSFSSDKEDKLEKEIDYALRMFLTTLELALRKADKDLKTSVTSAEQFDLQLKEGITSASSDMMLKVSAKDHEGKMVMVRLFAEAKRKIHNKDDDEILAQELAELLLAAKIRQSQGPTITGTEYNVFLLSWHHMTCYVTRLTIPKGYISRLPNAQPDQLSRLSVKRSVSLRMDEPKARIELAMALVQVVAQEFAGYARFTDKKFPSGGLVERLLS